MAQQPVSLEGCVVVPDPSPEHLYSFRIQMDGDELAILEVRRNFRELAQPYFHVTLFKKARLGDWVEAVCIFCCSLGAV